MTLMVTVQWKEIGSDDIIFEEEIPYDEMESRIGIRPRCLNVEIYYPLIVPLASYEAETITEQVVEGTITQPGRVGD